MRELNKLMTTPMNELTIGEYSFVIIQRAIEVIREEYKSAKKDEKKTLCTSMHLRYLKGSLDGQIYALSQMIIQHDYKHYNDIHDIFASYREEANFYISDLSQ